MRHLITILLFLPLLLNAQLPGGYGRQVLLPTEVDSLFYWFDANDVSTITTTNNKVTAWADKGPFGYDVAQADTSKAPTYSATSGPGGSTAAMVFDGTDDFLASAAHWWGSDDITVFVVMKFANATRDAVEHIVNRVWDLNERQWYFFASDASTTYASSVVFSQDLTASQSDGFFSPINFKHADYKLHSFTHSGDNNLNFFTNSNSVTFTQTVSNGNGTIVDFTNPLLVGCANAGVTPSGFLQGSISEIIVYTRALTNAERQGIEAYLAKKYGLKLNSGVKNLTPPKRFIQPTSFEDLWGWYSSSQGVYDATLSIAIDSAEGIRKLEDLSGNGRDVVQTNASYMPKWFPQYGSSGYPGLLFDGIDDRFMTSSASTFGGEGTALYVMSYVDTPTDQEIVMSFGDFSGNARSWRIFTGYNSYDRLAFMNSTDGTYTTSTRKYQYTTPSVTSMSLVVIKFSSSAKAEIWVNGTKKSVSLIDSGAYTINQPTQYFTLGAHKNGTTITYPAHMYFVEGVLFNRALELWEINKLMYNYFGQKYPELGLN